jgi:hypothetical protein
MSDRRERSPEPRRGRSVYEDRLPPSKPRTRRFRMYPSGQIVELDLPAGPEPPVEEIPPEAWVELGSIDPVSGRPEIDWRRAGHWRPLAEFLRPW